ncbi:MAG: ABC transporter ATP-binding protein [Candidatus Schekmanbacteria bacterium]|nr:ABC transporter ATP-binding protein [Candidatus Schekmanbacteria bacterium]
MANNSSLAVSCRQVTKTYGSGSAQVQALRGIDLEVYSGELMMLVGPSGCGKTTLISVIAGILNHDNGDCVVFDHDFNKMREKHRTRFRGQNIGFVFQAYNLFPTLTAAENACVPLVINGMSKRQAIKKAVGFLERVGLSDKLNRLPADLSGGQQQRVAIARAMVHNPRLIVCDEPTSALDHQTGHKIMELLREVAVGPTRALIVVTHDARIFEFADRIAKMDDGHIEKVVNSAKEL